MDKAGMESIRDMDSPDSLNNHQHSQDPIPGGVGSENKSTSKDLDKPYFEENESSQLTPNDSKGNPNSLDNPWSPWSPW